MIPNFKISIIIQLGSAAVQSTNLVNNADGYMFEDILCEFNGIEISKTNNVGITFPDKIPV